MKIVVEGVTIELTKEQIALIEKEKAKRAAECASFERTLKNFGFAKVDTTGWADPKEKAFANDEHGWYAEIQDYRKYKACLLVGKGLISMRGFPGGYIHESPESVAKAITAALDGIEL